MPVSWVIIGPRGCSAVTGVAWFICPLQCTGLVIGGISRSATPIKFFQGNQIKHDAQHFGNENFHSFCSLYKWHQKPSFPFHAYPECNAIYACIYILLYIFVYIHLYICLYKCLYIYLYIYACIHTCIYA